MKTILILCFLAMLCIFGIPTEIARGTSNATVPALTPATTETSTRPGAENPYSPGTKLYISTTRLPEPAKMLLFGFALVGIGLVVNKNRTK